MPQRSTARRPAFFVVRCATIGAAFTMLTSWAAAIAAQMNNGGLSRLSLIRAAYFSLFPPSAVHVEAAWPMAAPPAWASRPGSVHTESLWYAASATAIARFSDGGDVTETMHIESSGWPLRAFRLWSMQAASTSQTITRESLRIHIPINNTTWTAIDLPLSPVWAGFAANTFFYGGLFAAMWQSAAMARRRLRRRADRCPRCNYDRAGLAAGAVCPECGCTPR